MENLDSIRLQASSRLVRLTTDLNALSSVQSSIGNSRTIINKYGIIQLYTIWENFITEIIDKIYKDFNLLVVNENFFKILVEDVLSGKHERKKISFANNYLEISEGILGKSNNTSYKKLFEILKRISLPRDFVEEYFCNFDINIKEKVEKVEDSGIIIPFDDEEEDEKNLTLRQKKRFLGKIKGIINDIVERRNTIAHNSELTELLTVEQLLKYIDFFDAIIHVLKDCIAIHLVRLAVDNQLVTKIPISEVIYENTETPVSWLKISLETPSDILGQYLYFEKSGSNFYTPFKIEELQNMGHDIIKSFQAGEQAIKVETSFKLRKDKLNNINIIDISLENLKGEKRLLIK